jgi:predicted phage replisome organizer
MRLLAGRQTSTLFPGPFYSQEADITPKRYYWLKLKDDFFTSKRIKKLRNMAGGDTYTIIYLKMQLLSLKTDGVLTWTGLEENFADELALDLDEKPEDVEVTLMYLLKTGLAETNDNVSFFFPFVVENTGSEDSSAQRVREFRKRQALQCNTEVTQVKRECNVEKEIEKREREERNINTRAHEDDQDEEDDRFDEFWAAYPKKTGDIKSAYFEYLGAIKTTAPETLIEAVKQQSKDMTREDFRYFPSAENWLKNKAWLTKSDFKEPDKKPKPKQDEHIPAFTPPEKRHKPYNLADMVEWPTGSNNYIPKSEAIKLGY